MSVNPEVPEPTAPHSGGATPPGSGDPASPSAPDYPAAPSAPEYPAAPGNPAAPDYPAAPSAPGYPTAPGYPAATPPGHPAAPAPQQGINGLAIAGLILAFCMAPVGLILSIIALVQTRKRGQKGKGLAVAGVVVSVVAMIIGTVALVISLVAVGKEVAKVADPGCVAGKDVILSLQANTSDPVAAKQQMESAVDGLNKAASKAGRDEVRDAMKALADDYSALMKLAETGTEPPASLMEKLEKDANKIDEVCTFGGAEK